MSIIVRDCISVKTFSVVIYSGNKQRRNLNRESKLMWKTSTSVKISIDWLTKLVRVRSIKIKLMGLCSLELTFLIFLVRILGYSNGNLITWTLWISYWWIMKSWGRTMIILRILRSMNCMCFIVRNMFYSIICSLTIKIRSDRLMGRRGILILWVMILKGWL